MQNQVPNKGIPLWAWGLLGLGAVVVVILLIAASVGVYFYTQPEVAEAPTVAIVSPANNSQVEIGKEIAIKFMASGKELSRAELLINGQVEREAFNLVPQAIGPWVAELSWTPKNAGNWTLMVRVSDATGQYSSPATLVLNAIESLTPTATTTPTLATPTETATATATEMATLTPLPGQPKVTANTSVNVRGGPGIGYSVLGNLTANQSADVIGKSADGWWWQIRFASAPNGIAWVSTKYVTAENTENVPIVTAPPLPDKATDTPTPKPQCVPSCPSDQAEWITMPAGTHLYDLLRARGWETDAELAEKRELVKRWSCLQNPDQIPAGSQVCLPKPCQVVAPNLVGKVVGEAMGLAVTSKLEPVVETSTGCTPSNVVSSTVPAADQTILCHSTITLSVGCTTPVTQTLPWWVNGSVADFAGDPIPGVQVTCWRVTNTEERVGVSVTNDQGSYDMVSDFPDVGGLHCEARKTGWQVAEKRYEGRSEKGSRAYTGVDFVLASEQTPILHHVFGVVEDQFGRVTAATVCCHAPLSGDHCQGTTVNGGYELSWQNLPEVPERCWARKDNYYTITLERESWWGSDLKDGVLQLRIDFFIRPKLPEEGTAQYATSFAANRLWISLNPPPFNVQATCVRSFERGGMLYYRLENTIKGVILTYKNDGSFLSDLDEWDQESLCKAPSRPPAGLYIPDRGIGYLWCTKRLVDQIGWSTEASERCSATWNSIQGGGGTNGHLYSLIWTHPEWGYVWVNDLNDQTYMRYNLHPPQ